MSYLWHLRWLIPLAGLGLIFYQAVLSLAPITAVTDFTVRTRQFGVLLPAGRVELAPGGIKVIAEPLYFDVKLPLHPASLTVELVTSADSAPLKLGQRQGEGWDYSWPQVIYTIKPVEQIYSLNTSEFKYLEFNRAQRFLISAPGLASGHITIRRARVTITRRPFILAAAINSLTNKLTGLWR